MRKLLLVVVVATSACAHQPPTLGGRGVVSYRCDGHQVTREAGVVRTADARLTLGWQDEQGDHFVSPMGTERVEYVMPVDPRASAIERHYDTGNRASHADWRMVDQDVCVARGGYADVLTRFSSGQSIDDLAREYSVDRGNARKLVYGALMRALVDYHRQR